MKHYIVTVEIDTKNLTSGFIGAEISAMLREAADTMLEWPGANSFSISLHNNRRDNIGTLSAIEED